jgi:protein TonB
MIMRSVSFFVLSLFLHAAVLVYPVSFGGRTQTELIQVTILPLEEEGGGAEGQRGNGSPAAPPAVKSSRAAPPATEARVVAPQSFVDPERQGLRTDSVAAESESSIALISAIANSAGTVAPAISNPAVNDANGIGAGFGGTGSGNGFGSSSTGFGRGSGNGVGSGSSGTGIALTQARYRDTPRPDYPESARREGREGLVLLRVLVDDQGRSKKVEIHKSSDSEILDRAAVEAIKRWRFHPARYGDKPVESWLRIPIEFRLADANVR